MIGYVEAPRAWGLVRGMARALGVDLVGAVTEGWLTRAELAALVETCESCDRAGECTAWLAVHVQSEGPPPFCHNADGLTALTA